MVECTITTNKQAHEFIVLGFLFVCVLFLYQQTKIFDIIYLLKINHMLIAWIYWGVIVIKFLDFIEKCITIKEPPKNM